MYMYELVQCTAVLDNVPKFSTAVYTRLLHVCSCVRKYKSHGSGEVGMGKR
eukprot:SAG31_NODE_5533_length_2471_cov_1.929595_2_plen_51_part_00